MSTLWTLPHLVNSYHNTSGPGRTTHHSGNGAHREPRGLGQLQTAPVPHYERDFAQQLGTRNRRGGIRHSVALGDDLKIGSAAGLSRNPMREQAAIAAEQYDIPFAHAFATGWLNHQGVVGKDCGQ